MFPPLWVTVEISWVWFRENSRLQRDKENRDVAVRVDQVMSGALTSPVTSRKLFKDDKEVRKSSTLNCLLALLVGGTYLHERRIFESQRSTESNFML